MSIAKLCPYDKSEHCKYERYYGEPMFSKCKNCEIKNSGRYETKEKEAEEYIKEHTFFDEEYGVQSLDVVSKTIYKDGAEFGYNKAKEDADKMKSRFLELCNLKDMRIAELEKANEWHYVKDELPPENVPLNIITFDKNKKRRVWVGEYNGGKGQWWTGYFNHFIDVPYAWKEIVLPELKESE